MSNWSSEQEVIDIVVVFEGRQENIKLILVFASLDLECWFEFVTTLRKVFRHLRALTLDRAGGSCATAES